MARVGGPRKDTVDHGRGVFSGGWRVGKRGLARVGWTTKYSKFTKGEAGERVVGKWFLHGWTGRTGLGKPGRSVSRTEKDERIPFKIYPVHPAHPCSTESHSPRCNYCLIAIAVASCAISPRRLCRLIHPISPLRQPNPEPPHHCQLFFRVFRVFRG